MDHFNKTLAAHDLQLTRRETTTLQINVGLLCNQTCRHCHLDAGPDRQQENMNQKTAEAVVAYAQRSKFDTIDITGGAPELNPNLPYLIESLSRISSRIMLRSNLSALNNGKNARLMDLISLHQVVIVASFSSLDESQANGQRGDGVFQASIKALQKLNSIGYGQSGTGLELNLVANPTGAFLPVPQAQSEKRFREVLHKKWGIEFNHLYSFANVPIGRFREWLKASGNFDAYMKKLANAFNPCAVDAVMCRALVSVSWEGYLYDCDFNLARSIPLGGCKRTHILDMPGKPQPGNPIATSDHCYTCTAGTGFT
ncbi:MAG: radical SAM protein [Desulfobacterales bacterium CG23_combo_of_CG06-09_8_20_14_all_51_8]|nr:MAG: radical SAM protein [Desulfobacterales bacterium CG23_combo_of_CG06-09_8_20_14_all_51_8]